METKNYKCTQDYLNDEDVICFKKGELYQFYKDNDGWYQTKKNHQGYAHEIEQEEIDEYFFEVLGNSEQLGNYDFINPDHYKKYSVEVIDMMIAIYGKEKTAAYCELNAFKYRMRMGEKPEQPINRDLEKEKWYINKANELRK